MGDGADDAAPSGARPPSGGTGVVGLHDLRSLPGTALDVVRTVAWLLLLAVLKRLLPLPRLARLMWREPRPGRRRSQPRDERVALTVRRVCRRWDGSCLPQSLILYRILSRRGRDPELVMGVRGDDPSQGHAWLVVDGAPILETAESLSGHVEVARFGTHGRLVRLQPDVEVSRQASA